MSIHNSRQISDVKILLKTGVDGAGIVDIEKTGTQGLVDTYTITLSNGSKYTFTVTNGQGIESIEKTGTQGLVDTYTILFKDGTTQDFTVTNGNGITSIEKTDTQGLVDTYTITFDDGTTEIFTVTNGRDGGMSAYILITSDVGSTVTVTTPSGVVIPATQISGSTTQWSCETDEFGIHTVTSVLNGQTMQKTLNIDVCKAYTINVEQFSATISVTYPSGATCTCVGGSESYTATSNPETFTVHSANTFTITATDGTATDTATVTITTIGQSETVTLSFIPDGSTVLPTDNIQTWLHCANIWDKAYTTISQVLTDSTTLSALIASSNAVDYMVRSTTWATNVCSDSTAMSLIGLNNNCSDTLLANTTWLNAICNSTYFESVLNVKVPTMTSATSPSGRVTASNQSSSYPAWKSFDGDDSTYWTTGSYDKPQWIQYEFTSQIEIKKVKFAFSSAANSCTYNISGSNDGSSFVTIKNAESLANTNNQTYNKIINQNLKYKYLRFTLTAQSVTDGTVGHITTLQFYGRA